MKKLLLSIAGALLISISWAQTCNTTDIYATTGENAVCFDTTFSKVRNIYSNNYPDHTDSYTSSFTVEESENEYSMCLYPDTSDSFTPLYEETETALGCNYTYQFGVASNGIGFTPNSNECFENTSTGENNIEWHIEARYIFNGKFGNNGGHINAFGSYHYHDVPVDYYTDELNITIASHSPIVGFAADGFPIYYKFVYSDADDATSSILDLSSGYTLIAGNRPGDGVSAPDGAYTGLYYEDYEYTSSGAELDECNGRYGVTPDYPNGTYYYVLTDNYPYIPRCFKGTVLDNTFRSLSGCPESTAEDDCSDNAIISGCTDAFACNYDGTASNDDGTCTYYTYSDITEIACDSYTAPSGAIVSTTIVFNDTLPATSCPTVYTIDLTIDCSSTSKCDALNESVITGWDLNTTGKTTSYWIRNPSNDTYVYRTSTELADILSVCYDTDTVYITTEGMTNDMGQFTNPVDVLPQGYIFKFPIDPVAGTGNDAVPETNTIGVLINGIPMFGLGDGSTYQNQGVWVGEAYYSEGHTLDTAFAAHPEPNGGAYHTHATPFRLYDDPGTTHSPIVGFAHDGYPVYGPFGYSTALDNTSGITRMVSGYELRNITNRTTLADGSMSTPPGPDVTINGDFDLGIYIQDYEYVSGVGTLDEHNGRLCITPEYPEGTYAYFVTVDAAGTPQFPYYIGTTYYGTPIDDNHNGTGEIPSSGLTCWDGTAALAYTSTITNATCGLSNGTIILTASGGDETSYQYSFDGSDLQTSGSFSGYASGDYQVIIDDGTGCQVIETITLENGSSLEISAVVTADPTCNAGTDGTIIITATGGTGTLSYSSDNGANFQSSNEFTDLTATTYLVVVKDDNDCEASSTETLTEPTVIAFSATVIDETCGSIDGAITITASGGKGTLSYSADNGSNYQTSNEFTGLAAATYSLIVKDDNACQITGSETVSNSNAPSIDAIVSVSPLCHAGTDGIITVTASGGTGTLSYSSDNGANFQTSNEFTDLTAGVYSVIVKDDKACQTSASETLVAPTIIAFTSVATDETCGSTDGTITITANGGTGILSYSSDNGSNFQSSNEFTGLAAATYSLIVKDDNACQITGNETVSNSNAPSIDAVVSVSPLCHAGTDGIITVTASGGTGTLSYSSDNGANFQTSNEFTDLTAGVYSVIVKDDKACQTSASETLVAPTIIAFTSVATDETCGSTDGTIIITANGGTGTLSYSSDNGSNFQSSNEFTGLAATTYSLIVQDDNACQITGNETVSNSDAPSIDAVVSVPPLCNNGTDGTITITATGGTGTLVYSADNGDNFQSSNEFTDLTVGTYSLVVKDDNTCQATASETLTAPTIIAFTSVVTDETCGSTNGTITITATGGTGSLSYSTDNGDNFQSINEFTDLTAGTYSLVVKDDNACQITDSETIVDNNNTASIVIVAVGHPSCFEGTDGTIAITAGGSGSYMYSIDGTNFGSTSTFSNVSAGDYTVVVEDEFNCAVTTTKTLTDPSELTISSTSMTETTCSNSNGEILISAMGGTGDYSYSVDNGSSTQSTNEFSTLSTGTYSLLVADENNCQATESVEVTATDAIAISSVIATDANCGSTEDGTLTVTASGVGILQYSVDGTTFQSTNIFTGLSTGNYTITVKDDNDCETTSTSTIDGPTEVVYSTDITDAGCSLSNGTITIAASGGTGSSYTYSFDNSTYQSSGEFTGMAAGTFDISVLDGNNCEATGTGTIGNADAPTFDDVSLVNPTCSGDTDGTITISATGGTGDLAYSIDNGNSYQVGNEFTALPGGTYIVVIQDENDCEVGSSETLTERTVISISSSNTAETCTLEEDGIIIISASGGTGDLAYSVDNGSNYQSDNTFTSLASTTYQISVEDENNCQATGSETLTAPTEINFTSAIVNEVCATGNGIITITATGGTGSLSYSSDNGLSYQADNEFLGIIAGAYELVVKDDNTCETTGSAEVENAGGVTIDAIIAVSPLCNNDLNGTITINATGGVGTLHYSIDDGSNYQEETAFSLLSEGNYSIFVNDATNCPARGLVTLTNPELIVLSTITENEVIGNDGTIDLTVAGGTEAYSFAWDNAMTTEDLTDLSAGTYSVIVTDANSCTSTTEATVTEVTGFSSFKRTDIILYPNPSSEVITIEIEEDVFEYKVFDVSGREIFAGESSNHIVNIEKLAIGAYIIVVKSGENSYSLPFVRK